MNWDAEILSRGDSLSLYLRTKYRFVGHVDLGAGEIQETRLATNALVFMAVEHLENLETRHLGDASTWTHHQGTFVQFKVAGDNGRPVAPRRTPPGALAHPMYTHAHIHS